MDKGYLKRKLIEQLRIEILEHIEHIPPLLKKKKDGIVVGWV